jgi:hypothetical protein
MNAGDLIVDAPFPDGDRREQLLQARLLLNYLADHVYHAGLRDATDFRQWLLELAEAARPGESIASSTAEFRKTTTPSPQRRYFSAEFCPDCGHIHADDEECGFPIGGGRKCRCERTVPA